MACAREYTGVGCEEGNDHLGGYGKRDMKAVPFAIGELLVCRKFDNYLLRLINSLSNSSTVVMMLELA